MSLRASQQEAHLRVAPVTAVADRRAAAEGLDRAFDVLLARPESAATQPPGARSVWPSTQRPLYV
jgi:hypothetical protein